MIDYNETYGMSKAEAALWRYEHDENFGCYDIGSMTDYGYQRLREQVREEREQRANKR